MKRKTVEIEKVKTMIQEEINNAETPELKRMFCLIMEKFLFSVNSYCGFYYPYWIEKGNFYWMANGKPEDKTPYIGPEWERHYF